MVDKESIKFHQACKDMLNKESFDDFIKKEKYKAYKYIACEGKDSICRNCMYCDMINQKCVNNLRVELKMESCYKAKNIYLLKKAGLYGQKKYH